MISGKILAPKFRLKDLKTGGNKSRLVTRLLKRHGDKLVGTSQTSYNLLWKGLTIGEKLTMETFLKISEISRPRFRSSNLLFPLVMRLLKSISLSVSWMGFSSKRSNGGLKGLKLTGFSMVIRIPNIFTLKLLNATGRTPSTS
jgi:hypothetical protein